MRRASALGWTIIVAIAAIDVLWSAIAGFELRSLTSFPTALIPLPVVAACYFRWARPNPVYFVLFDALAQLMSFGALGVFSYLVFSTHMPLVDRSLAAIDHALGIDWPALIAWIQQHSAIDAALYYAYNLSVAQALLLLLILCYRQPERAQELILLMMLSMVLTTVIAGILPATTAYMFYGPSHPELTVEIPMDRDFFAIRDGSLRVLDLMTMEGMVGFPSYHTSMAVIFIYVLRGRRVLFPIGVALNLVVIASTLSAGAHYGVDLIGGAAVVLVAIRIFKAATARRFLLPLVPIRIGSAAP